MGFDNRDYAREEPQYQDSYSRGGGGFTNPFGGGSIVTKRIIIVTVVVFLLQIMGLSGVQPGVGSSVTNWLKLSLPDLLHGQVWRLVTYAFCHSEGKIFHILFNMLFVWWFGKTIETLYGSKEFLLFYLTAAIAAGVAFVGIDLVTTTDLSNSAAVVGASGAVMAIVMVFACHFPRQKILLMLIIPVEIRWVVLGYVFFETLPVLSALVGRGAPDGIAHSAHLGGLLFGYLYYRFQWRLTNLFGNWKKPDFSRTFGARRKIKIYAPPENVSDSSEIDAILEKISNEGMDSLTKKERKTLEKASKEANRRKNN